MKDGLSKGVDKSRAGVEQLLDASRRLGEVLSQSGEEGARASEKYNSRLVGLRQGVEKMSASLKAMGVSEKDTAGVLMKSSEQNVKFVEVQAGRLRSMEDALRSALESGNTALAETTKAEMEQVETWINEALNAIQKNAELIPTIVKNASSTVPDQQTESMRAQLRLLTNEIASTTVEYRRMTEAERNSAAGMELKRKLEDLIKKAGELRDAMDDANTQIRGEASDTKHLDGIAQGLNVVTSSAGAAVSVYQMFGASQEELIDIQTKLQATLAISNALTVIQNNLQKESSLMMGIRMIQEKAHAAAITLRTAAEGRGIIVTKAATIAQAAFNAVANANPYVLLATAILTVVGALVTFTVGSKEATAAEKRQREEGERLRKQQEDMSRALGQAAGDVEAKYRSLQQQWSRLKTESEKNKWIKENANKFHELGLNVNSVADAEQVLVNMAPQVIAALKAVAEAEAYSDLYKQAIKERAEKWEHRVKSRATGDYYTTAKQGERITDDEYRAAGLTAGDINYSTMYSPSAGISYTQNLGLTKSGVDKVNAYRREQARETNRQLKEGFNENVDFYAGKWEEAERKAAETQSKIPAHLRYNGGGGSGGSGGSGRNGRGGNGGGNDLKDEEDRAEALTELQAKNRQAEIDQMAEGAEKKRAQLRLDYDKDIAELAELEKEWQSAQKGELTKEQAEALESARTLAKARLDAGENKVVIETLREEEKANQAAINGYLKQWGDYSEKKQAIYAEANEKICQYEEDMSRATTEESRQALLARIGMVKAEAKQQVEQLDAQYGKAKGFMIDLFGDASEKTIKEIDKIIKKYEALVKFLEGNGDVSRGDLLELGFTESEITKAIEKLERGEITVKEFTDKLKELNGVLGLRSPWQKFQNNIAKAVDQIKNADGDPMKIGKSVEAIGNAVTEFTPQLKQFSSDIGDILGFDDSKIQDAISGVEGLGTAASGVGQILSGDVVGGIQNAVHGISQLVSALDGMFGADYSEYEHFVEQYDRLISVWDTLIDRKSEYVGMSYGIDAIKAREEVLSLIEKEAEAYRTLGRERLNSGASAGSHSIGVRIRKDMSGADWQRIAQSLGMSVAGAQEQLGGRLEGLFDLTANQIKKLQEDNQVWWSSLDEDVRKYLDGIIENEEQWAAMQEQMRERLTSTTRESVFSGFLDDLYKAADGSEDVMDEIADNWQKMVNRMAVNNLVGAKFQKNLEEWYENLAKLNEARTNGEITDEEYRKRLDALKAEYDGYVESAKRDIETLRTEGIVKATEENSGVTQSGKAGAFTTMSQDQSGKLEGLFVSGQMHWASMDDKLTDVTRQMDEAGDHLRQIATNTGSSAQALGEIKEDIKKMIRDGLKVK